MIQALSQLYFIELGRSTEHGAQTAVCCSRGGSDRLGSDRLGVGNFGKGGVPIGGRHNKCDAWGHSSDMDAEAPGPLVLWSFSTPILRGMCVWPTAPNNFINQSVCSVIFRICLPLRCIANKSPARTTRSRMQIPRTPLPLPLFFH